MIRILKRHINFNVTLCGETFYHSTDPPQSLFIPWLFIGHCKHFFFLDVLSLSFSLLHMSRLTVPSPSSSLVIPYTLHHINEPLFSCSRLQFVLPGPRRWMIYTLEYVQWIEEIWSGRSGYFKCTHSWGTPTCQYILYHLPSIL